MKKKNNKTTNKKAYKIFLEWLDNYSDFISYHENDETVFLDIAGDDGGDVTKKGLKDDKSVIFDKPETVDNWYKEVMGCYDFVHPKTPEISFTEYYTQKAHE